MGDHAAVREESGEAGVSPGLGSPWRRNLTVALIAVVVLAVGMAVYRDRSSHTNSSAQSTTDSPPQFNCETAGPTVDTDTVTRIVERLGTVSDLVVISGGCGTSTVKMTIGQDAPLYLSYALYPPGVDPADGSPAMTGPDGEKAWIVHGRPGSTEVERSAVAEGSNSTVVTVPLDGFGTVGTLSDEAAAALVLDLLQGA